jgi:enoyl-CoA hydratase/carnithine racemase
MLLARVLDAQRAYEAGLVNEIVPIGTQVEAALRMGRELSKMAPLVLRTLKRFVTSTVLASGPSEHFGRAKRDMEIIAQSEDVQEGFSSYREKRAPIFKGR